MKPFIYSLILLLPVCTCSIMLWSPLVYSEESIEPGIVWEGDRLIDKATDRTIFVHAPDAEDISGFFSTSKTFPELPAVFSLAPETLESRDCIDYGDYVHWVGGVDTPGEAWGVAVSGRYTYIADRESGLQVVDVTDSQSPSIVGSVGTPDHAVGVAVSGSYVYVADEDSGLHILPTQCDVTSIGDVGTGAPLLPQAFRLSQNYPNPFNPSTTIHYDVPERQPSIHVEISVYDIRGRLIKKLVDEDKEPGSYSVNWDGRDSTGHRVSSGIYLYRMEIDRDFVSTKKMVLLK